MKWLNIESAPKDGTYVFLYLGSNEWSTEAYWCNAADGWLSSTDIINQNVTHWCPMPVEFEDKW